MWAYLCSFFLALSSIVLILAAYPPSLLIFHGLLQVSYQIYTTYLASLIFIPVAIHNIFLFASAWKYTKNQANDLYIRMDFTCQRVIKSIFVTTATLDAALLATYYSSPLLPLQAFSVFSAILITISALIIVLLAPTLLVIH